MCGESQVIDHCRPKDWRVFTGLLSSTNLIWKVLPSGVVPVLASQYHPLGSLDFRMRVIFVLELRSHVAQADSELTM